MGTGNEDLREAAGAETTQTLSYRLHESQGRVDLRTHGSVILFTSKTGKNWGGRIHNQLDHRRS